MNATENEDVGDETIDEERVCQLLTAGLEQIAEEEGLERLRIRTFEDAGVLTSNKGLVVKIGRAEFQVEVLRSN